MLRIEDVAKETKLTKRAIRYYEEIGLIDPPKRTDGGVRLYTRDDIERLNKITRAKEVLGFSLQELQEFLKLEDTIEQKRKEYKSSQDKAEKLQELRHISDSLHEELKMIELKLDSINKFKQELQQLQSKVNDILQKET